MNVLQVAALQMNLDWHLPAANRKRAERMLKGLSASPDLILLPEMFTTGFTMDAAQHWEEMEGETQQWMQKMANKHQALVGGSLIIREGHDYYNRFLFVSPDGLLAEYDKRHLFRMGGEHEAYEAGDSWVWVEYKGWRIVPMVCYDLRFPVWSRNRPQGEEPLAYDLLVYVANWPDKRVRHWETLLTARAIENQSYTIGVNRVGKDGNEIPYSGSSMILDPLGDPMEYNSGEEVLLEASLDPEALQRYRQGFPIWKDADVFEVYP
ncbi:MAG: amidohydrolase [Bacteroidota bacterium]